MPIEFTPGLTITPGLIFGEGEPTPVITTALTTESDLLITTESDQVLIIE
jgi:hypothetical protein